MTKPTTSTKMTFTKVIFTKMEIPLRDLSISEHNVRSEDTEQGALEKLALSIKTAGLINSLTVVGGDDAFEVICGGRRLTAIKKLVDDGDLAADYLVDCRVAPKGADITKLSLMENFVREPMRPAEEFEAFNKLRQAGLDETEIAHDFGTTVLAVKRRLRLANVAPDIFAAYRQGKLTLDDLQAFAATDNKDRQLTYFTNTASFSPYAIRTAMTLESYSSDHVFVNFVGLDFYERAGGIVERDLFSSYEDAFLTSPDILEKLVLDKLDAIAEDYRADGWSFADTGTSAQDYHRGYGIKFRSEFVAPGEADEQALAEISAKLESLDDDPQADATLVQDLLNRYRLLEEKQAVFTEEEKSQSGVFVHLRHDGQIDVRRGLAHREDLEKEQAGGGGARQADDRGQGADQAIAPESLSKSEEKPEYSGAVLDSLTAMRVKTFQASLAVNPTLASDLLLFNLVVDAFGKFCDKPLDITMTARGTRLNEAEVEATPAQETLFKIHDKFEKLLDVEDSALRATVFGLGETDKAELLNYCIGCSFKDQLGVSRPYNPNKYYGHSKGVSAVEVLIGANIREGWTPTVGSFCSRLGIKKLLEIGAEIIDDSWALSRASEKKAVLSKAVAKLFDPENASLNADQRARAAKWLPGVMINPEFAVQEGAFGEDDEVTGDTFSETSPSPESPEDLPAFLDVLSPDDDDSGDDFGDDTDTVAAA